MEQIVFSDLWEMYRIKFIIDSKPKLENFWALRGLSFKVDKGETVGIIGQNGAGKSTVLKIIAGMLNSDRGQVSVSGKTSGLMELGAGFQTELTGGENIHLICGLFGLSKAQIETIYEKIVEFADIGKFINAAVKYYSQGMFVRLAFAIAINIDSDILLIDDTLAVGDEYFQKKCIKRIFEMKDQGKTILLVTHDMNILRRLCQRAIFLKEGQLVKDGPVDEVIPLYIQTSGSKEGVAILEQNGLQLVFNNGRLFINWQGKFLTPDSGMYAAFLSSGAWYSSCQAEWEVSKDPDRLTATGVFFRLNCTQTWEIEILEGKVIQVNIEINSQEPLNIQEGCVNILLSEEYGEWFSSQEKGRFPQIYDKNNKWEPMLSADEPRRCIGVKPADSKKLPSFIVEQKDLSLVNNLQVFNSGYIDRSRVLQYSQKNLQNYTRDNENKLRFFSGRIILNTPNIEEYLGKLQQDSIISNGAMKLKFNQGRCIIYYGGKALTRADHATVSMNTGQRVYSSQTAHWELIEKDARKLVISGSWGNLPVTQIWRFEVTGENSFTWDVDINVTAEIDIESQHMVLQCLASYDNYYCQYGTGRFEDKFFESKVDALQRCVTAGWISLFNTDNQVVPMSFKVKDGLVNFFKIFNSDISAKARELWINKVEAEEKIRISPGSYSCFKVEVSLDKNERVAVCNRQALISEGRLKLLLDKDKLVIFWKEKQLTKGLGLYTSLRSLGRWFDSSSSASWDFTPEDKNIISTVKWFNLSLKQIWQISLNSENEIEFMVKMIVDQEIKVDRLQTNIMLSEAYGRWSADDKTGVFPEFAGSLSDDWQVLWSPAGPGNVGKNYAGVAGQNQSGNYLPAVKLVPEDNNSGWQLNILNSDLYHRGRVLQYLNKENTVLAPGEYPYFKGKILIEGV